MFRRADWEIGLRFDSGLGLRQMFIFALRDTMSTSRQGSVSRRGRFARSSTTTSVTQMLSDSCTSLLQKLTTRVRGTSALNDRGIGATTARRSPVVGTRLGSTRSRLEDKYSTILDKYSGKRHADDSERSRGRGYSRRQERDHSYYHRDDSPFVRDDKTLEPSMTRTIVKSPTNVFLSEKAYPYVSSAMSREPRREKTPAYSRTARQTLLNSEAYRRYGRHKSGHAETRNRKVRPRRNGKSEQLEAHSTSLRLSRPVKIEPLTFTNDKEITVDPDKTPVANTNVDHLSDVAQNVTRNALIEDVDPALSDRAAKRKEIQSLILKYAAMEDTYSQLAAGGQANVPPSTTDLIASKYRKSNQHKDDASKGAIAPGSVSAISEVDAIVSCRAAGCPDCVISRKRRRFKQSVSVAAAVLSSSSSPVCSFAFAYVCVCVCKRARVTRVKSLSVLAFPRLTLTDVCSASPLKGLINRSSRRYLSDKLNTARLPMFAVSTIEEDSPATLLYLIACISQCNIYQSLLFSIRGLRVTFYGLRIHLRCRYCLR